jgi:hypothetical protein
LVGVSAGAFIADVGAGDTGTADVRGLPRGGEHLPGPGHTLELVFSALDELDARSHNEVFDRS